MKNTNEKNTLHVVFSIVESNTRILDDTFTKS